jgi:hypothetical protein
MRIKPYDFKKRPRSRFDKQPARRGSNTLKTLEGRARGRPDAVPRGVEREKTCNWEKTNRRSDGSDGDRRSADRQYTQCCTTAATTPALTEERAKPRSLLAKFGFSGVGSAAPVRSERVLFAPFGAAASFSVSSRITRADPTASWGCFALANSRIAEFVPREQPSVWTLGAVAPVLGAVSF